MTEETKVPLAEHFHSIQGEGAWTGLPMHFLRFPGCSVGREQTQKLLGGDPLPFPATILPNGAEAKVCCDFTGTHFFCDTDYAKHEELLLKLLVDETFETVACFSGGEPLIHENSAWYDELYHALRCKGTKIHIETSGTILPNRHYDWLTVSPKANWRYDTITRANQIKFLIGAQPNLNLIDEIADAANHNCQFFLSPIFDPNELVRENLETAIHLLQSRYRSWRLSVQVHKWLSLR